MMNLINRSVKHKNGQIFVVDKQDNGFVTLSNGKTYDYITMFSSNAFVLIDDDLQKQVLQDIKQQIEKIEDTNIKKKVKEQLEKEWQKVEDLLNSKSIGRDISCIHGKDLSLLNSFIYKSQYGGKALTIYENGIKYLNFNSAKKHSFDLQQILYAQNCTIEGYSVWMLPYSTLNGKSNGSWANFIEIENKQIIQYTFVKDTYVHEPNEKRLAFVKQKNGNYVFLGVYFLKERIENYFDGKCVAKEIYSLVSENYPEED